ncbi:MAG: DUF3572 family protein, partial [Pikeienuella sp.]
MTPDAAEKIALEALLWIAADEDLSGGLLSMSGAAAGDLRGLQRIYDQPVKSGSNKLFGAGTWKEGSYHL